MKIEVIKASLEDKSVLRNLMELYAYDFSEFDDADVDTHGLYGYSYLDNYWTEEERHPFLVKADGKLAGLALVRCMTDKDNLTVYSMAEFFILRKYRKQGTGRMAARQVFDLFPGAWHVAELANNIPAQAFWRKVIGEYTQGDFTERWDDNEEWHGPVQRFTSKTVEKGK